VADALALCKRQIQNLTRGYEACMASGSDDIIYVERQLRRLTRRRTWLLTDAVRRERKQLDILYRTVDQMLMLDRKLPEPVRAPAIARLRRRQMAHKRTINRLYGPFAEKVQLSSMYDKFEFQKEDVAKAGEAVRAFYEAKPAGNGEVDIAITVAVKKDDGEQIEGRSMNYYDVSSSFPEAMSSQKPKKLVKKAATSDKPEPKKPAAKKAAKVEEPVKKAAKPKAKPKAKKEAP
jgi:hypothetical protein